MPSSCQYVLFDRRKYLEFSKLLVIFLALNPVFLLASDVASNPVVELDKITVIGTRSKGTTKDNPHAVTIIDQKKIARNPISNIAEALEGYAGIETTDSNSAGTKRIRIRGENSRRVTVLIDGQELTDHSNYGTPILENISEVAKIEVLHGPASVLYGSKAIGGVVDIITKDGVGKNSINGEIGSTYYGESRGWLLNTALFGQINQFDYRLSAYTENHQDIRTPESIYTSYLSKLEHTKKTSSGLNVNLGYTFGESFNHLIRMKLESAKLSSENWREPGILNSGFIPLTFFDITLPKRDRQKIGFFYSGEDINDTIKKIRFDAYYQTVKRVFDNKLTSNIFETDDFVMSSIKGNTPLPIERMIPHIIDGLSVVLKPIEFAVDSHSDDRLINYGSTFQVDFALAKNHYVITGLHYLSDRLASNKLSHVGFRRFPDFLTNTHIIPAEITQVHLGQYIAHINTVSLFMQDEWQMADNIKLITGLRYYNVATMLDHAMKVVYKTGKEHKLLKAMSVVYTGIPNTILRMSYSEGYISPNLMQLFMSSDAAGFASLPNPKLKSETAKNIEVGARYADNHVSFDGTLFLTESKDYISLRGCRDNPLCTGVSRFRPSAIYENVDRSKTYGLELGMSYLIPQTNFTPYVDMTWLKRKESLATRDSYDTDTPKFSGRIGIRYDNTTAPIPVEANFYLRGASGVKLAPELNPNYPGGSKFIQPLSSWVTVNFEMGIIPKIRKSNPMQVILKMTNITNTKYRGSFNRLPGSARNISISTKWTF